MPSKAQQGFSLAVLATLFAFTAAPARAQMPPDIAARIAALGRVVDPNATGAIYAPLQEHEPYSGIKVLRDVKYGPSERNVMDVFAAENLSDARPAFVQFPGRYSQTQDRPVPAPTGTRHHDTNRQGHVPNGGRVC
jgi:hypothetical protein